MAEMVHFMSSDCETRQLKGAFAHYHEVAERGNHPLMDMRRFMLSQTKLLNSLR